MLGGFIGLTIVTVAHLSLAGAILEAMIGMGLIGVILDLIWFRPVNRSYFLAPALSTIGFGIVVRDLMVNIVGSEPKVFLSMVKLLDFQIGSLLISSIQLLILGTSLLLMVGLALFVKK